MQNNTDSGDATVRRDFPEYSEAACTSLAENATALVADLSPVFSTAENPFLFPMNLLHSGEELEELAVVSSSAPAWWLLHTKPRQEKKLAEQLASLEIAHYLPVIKRHAVTRGRTRISRLPLFPGYFFLWATPEQRRQALETNRLVATHEVGDAEELRIRLWELANLIERGAPLTAAARLVAGRRVRVKSGLFRDMEGTVLKRGGKTRLFVLVSEILGGVSLEIEEHLLEPIF